jgi:glycerophosphoryl diester phosphodiesterase
MANAPIVIAHRGASGYLPEHTLESKALAYGLGADFLEQDVVATRDSELVVLHDLYLDDVTDVADHFPRRCRTDGHYYVIDFDLAELQRLSVSERRLPGSVAAKYPQRFPAAVRELRIATLDQELQLIQGLNRAMKRNVGVYAEVKDPQWHFEHGVDLARLLLAKLAEYGYSSIADEAFVQCFDAAELLRIKSDLNCKLRLIQLTGIEPQYATLVTRTGVRQVAEYAHGIGPSHSQLVTLERGGPRVGPLCTWAHDVGLHVHPYTFRSDDLPIYADRLEQMLELFFMEVGVDGVFCDHPDVAVRVRDALCARRRR